MAGEHHAARRVVVDEHHTACRVVVDAPPHYLALHNDEHHATSVVFVIDVSARGICTQVLL